MEIKQYLSDRRVLVEKAMRALIPQPEYPFETHIKSMRYSLFAGGKRIRPILCLATAECFTEDKQSLQPLYPVLCALECIHTYSLIHDDLPAMDDDALRRGKPTNHVLFGEAEAILAGDGLLTMAFEMLSDPANSPLDTSSRLKIIHVIARAAGSYGMVGGQSLDMAYEGVEFPFEMLKEIHRNKTGALILASIQAGAIFGSADTTQFSALSLYGKHIGLAFQIVDDLLNVTSTTEKLGKAAGSDAEKGKATYPVYFGIDGTREKAKQAVEEAKDALATFAEKGDHLRALADYILARSH